MVEVRQQENSFGKLHTNDVIEKCFMFQLVIGLRSVLLSIYKFLKCRSYKPKDYVQLRIRFKCYKTDLNVVLAVRGPEKSSNERIPSYAWT